MMHKEITGFKIINAFSTWTKIEDDAIFFNLQRSIIHRTEGVYLMKEFIL